MHSLAAMIEPRLIKRSVWFQIIGVAIHPSREPPTGHMGLPVFTSRLIDGEYSKSNVVKKYWRPIGPLRKKTEEHT